MFSLIVDNRELALFSHIDLEIKTFKYEKMQLNNSDYLITFNTEEPKLNTEEPK